DAIVAIVGAALRGRPWVRNRHSSSDGRPRRAAPTKMLRTAVIGAGSLGSQHARIHAALAAEGLAQFTAVCDLNEDNARAVSSERKTDWTTDWRELIGRIDAA